MPLPPECYESSEECEKAIENKLNEVAILYLPGLEELARSYNLEMKDFFVMIPDFDASFTNDEYSATLKLEGTVLASAYFEPIKDCPKNLNSVYSSLIQAVGNVLEEALEEVLGDVYEVAEVYLEVDWGNLDVVIRRCPSPSSLSISLTGAL